MESQTIVLLVVAVVALAGAFFTAVPLVPGAIFPLLGAVACAVLSVGWDEFRWWFWAVQVVLLVGYLLVDNIAQVFGVRRLGGSRQAMVGGAVGVFVGPIALAIVLGPLALLLGPPIGAVVGTILGEEYARRSTIAVAAVGDDPKSPRNYARLGAGALVAYVVSTVFKLVLVAIQVVLLFVVAS